MKFVIINADDFGYSARVNRAVLRAHQEGVLTSASLMVAEEGWKEAVEIARDTPTLGVGLHVVTTYDRALLPASEIPHLIDPRRNGKFGADPFRVGLRYAFSSAAQAELRREMEAQFERFSNTELAWSHADGHQHFHLHPVVWDIMLELCDRFHVHRVRLPREELFPHLRSGGDGVNMNTVSMLFLRIMGRRCLRKLKQRRTLGGQSVFCCDRVYGQLQTGNMTADYALGLLERLDGDISEIYFHPGTEHARPLLLAQQTEGVYDVELQALLDPRLRTAMQRLNLQPVRYKEAEALRLITNHEPRTTI